MAGMTGGRFLPRLCSRWPEPSMSALHRLLTLAGLLLGIGAVGLQFALSMQAYLANGMTVPAALVEFLSYFTILTNSALVLVYLSALTQTSWLGWFRRPATRAMMTGIMLLVMTFYHVLLRPIWQPQGLFLLCDYLLHYAAPLFYALWWAVTQKHGMIAYGALPGMLVPPLLYLGYVMLRGAITTTYPYPTLNAAQLGYGQVALNVAMVAIGLIVLYIIVIGIDRALARRTAAS